MQLPHKAPGVLHHPGLGSAAAGGIDRGIWLPFDVFLCSAPRGAEVALLGAAEVWGWRMHNTRLRGRISVGGKANQLGCHGKSSVFPRLCIITQMENACGVPRRPPNLGERGFKPKQPLTPAQPGVWSGSRVQQHRSGVAHPSEQGLICSLPESFPPVCWEFRKSSLLGIEEKLIRVQAAGSQAPVAPMAQHLLGRSPPCRCGPGAGWMRCCWQAGSWI